GVIKVRIPAGGKPAQPWAIAGASSWSGAEATKAPASGFDLDMELRVEQSDPKQPDNLTIGLNLRPGKGAWSVSRKEISEQYEKIVRELKAYLQATISSPGDFIPK